MIEITLTEAQEAAITKEYGSLNYLQTYCENLANHLSEKQKTEYKQAKLIVLADADDVEVDALYDKIITEKETAEKLAKEQAKIGG